MIASDMRLECVSGTTLTPPSPAPTKNMRNAYSTLKRKRKSRGISIGPCLTRFPSGRGSVESAGRDPIVPEEKTLLWPEDPHCREPPRIGALDFATLPSVRLCK